MKTKGIDISTWQKPSQINYDMLAKEVDFVILRAGYTGHGTGVSLHKDDAFEKHYKAGAVVFDTKAVVERQWVDGRL